MEGNPTTSTTTSKNEKPKPVSKLKAPTFGFSASQSKRRRVDAVSATSSSGSEPDRAKPTAATKRTLRTGSTSAGKVPKATVSTSTSASSKALFTVGKKPPAPRPAQRQTSATKLSKSPAKDAADKPKTASKPKRAAWDTKGQLVDLRDELDKFKQTYRRDLEDKENEKQHLVTEKAEEIVGVESRLSLQLADQKAQHAADTQAYEQEMQALKEERDRLTGKLADSHGQITSLTDQNEQLTQELRLCKKERATLRLDVKESQLMLKTHSNTIQTLTGKFTNLEKDISKVEGMNRELEQGRLQHETERRQLHNVILELKGNIRVFCRVRPPLTSDGEQQQLFAYPDLDHKKISLSKPFSCNESSLSDTMKRTEKLEFSFDKIFEQQSTQHEVFEEISQLVQSALDGYSVCIFAYGQTGSGKTYTMQGPDIMTTETEGMIPRSILQIFESANELHGIGWQYSMEASFLEIYNETINDLLGEPRKEQKHEIKSASGNIVITNLTTVAVTHPRQVNSLFERATKNRHVAATNCNARSSRSHSVFTLKISGTNEVTSETSVGTLNLVDLAGSERLKESKSTGDRLKETQCINTSLSALGNVIMGLAAKKSHIPFRDSKLTYLLQNSLGGNSKTLMFVNVSPKEDHFNETLNSLRFATKVNNCSIGTAKKTVK